MIFAPLIFAFATKVYTFRTYTGDKQTGTYVMKRTVTNKGQIEILRIFSTKEKDKNARSTLEKFDAKGFPQSKRVHVVQSRNDLSIETYTPTKIKVTQTIGGKTYSYETKVPKWQDTQDVGIGWFVIGPVPKVGDSRNFALHFPAVRQFTTTKIVYKGLQTVKQVNGLVQGHLVEVYDGTNLVNRMWYDTLGMPVRVEGSKGTSTYLLESIR